MATAPRLRAEFVAIFRASPWLENRPDLVQLVDRLAEAEGREFGVVMREVRRLATEDGVELHYGAAGR